jgi:hypothetical protein
VAIDVSKLKGRRRGLGAPPADGSPGIEAEATDLNEEATVGGAVQAERRTRADSGGAVGLTYPTRQRVPPVESEPRMPFTTRVTLSTKERLEDACHFLRVKHQDFINQAIVAHLEKHGF